jgi:hypothetical protein
VTDQEAESVRVHCSACVTSVDLNGFVANEKVSPIMDKSLFHQRRELEPSASCRINVVSCTASVPTRHAPHGVTAWRRGHKGFSAHSGSCHEPKPRFQLSPGRRATGDVDYGCRAVARCGVCRQGMCRWKSCDLHSFKLRLTGEGASRSGMPRSVCRNTPLDSCRKYALGLRRRWRLLEMVCRSPSPPALRAP